MSRLAYVSCITLSVLVTSALAQYNPQTYPDPRVNPAACKVLFPGQLCDPSEILTPEQRAAINEKVLRLQSITATIRNTSPPCANAQNSNLYIMVALIERLGSMPFESVSVERFTNLLRSRYLNYQDVGLCDTLILIVNSRADRQVFTVAGRDAKLSREVLQSAFQRNLVHFRSSNYAMGLEGMIENIVSAYNSAHILQVPTLGAPDNSGIVQVPSSNGGVGQFASAAVHGVRQKLDYKAAAGAASERVRLDDVPEDDKLWVQLMANAVGRCGVGADSTAVVGHVRVVVEEAMALSLKLISDSRYNRIEEASQDTSSGPQARDRAWQSAGGEFLNEMYARYGSRFAEGAHQCPALGDSSASALTRVI